MSGVNIIRKMAKNCGAKNPAFLTSTKFRKHIATTLQLMNMGEDEMEQIATFMGHTKKTHKEFYRLPQDIYQTAKVAKVLILLEKGKGNEFKGKTLEEINLENDIYSSSDSDDDEQLPLPENKLKRILSEDETVTTRTLNKKIVMDSQYEPATSKSSDRNPDRKELETDNTDMTLTYRQIELDTVIAQNDKKSKAPIKSNISGRSRWSVEEKKLVLKFFHEHVKKKITPKKHECEQLISSNKNILLNKDWIKVKTFVYNSFRLKQ
ncbi:hypothetical protein NQ318_022176 [Aromia moschata]|uniref:Uncharacterized protein n=1 Tax=Aromia moschata TaxID=1265417 RepID=A0AAV8Z6I7_9CUCU|nr:hypothetical protein NQ318_022176 [Aromia moschata]